MVIKVAIGLYNVGLLEVAWASCRTRPANGNAQNCVGSVSNDMSRLQR